MTMYKGKLILPKRGKQLFPIRWGIRPYVVIEEHWYRTTSWYVNVDIKVRKVSYKVFCNWRIPPNDQGFCSTRFMGIYASQRTLRYVTQDWNV